MAARQRRGAPRIRADVAVKVCVHCKCDKSEHELPPNQAGSVYERLGIKPPANMPISSSRDDAPGSVSHGYSWVPPGLTRKKLSTVFFSIEHISKNLEVTGVEVTHDVPVSLKMGLS
ncbi:hypothetical protein V3C99_006340 [Haemonchus contortus]